MKDSFFIKPPSKGANKRKERAHSTTLKGKRANRQQKENRDDEDYYSDKTDPDFQIGDIDQMDLEHHNDNPLDHYQEEEEEEEDKANEESVQEKRVRLAKEYLNKISHSSMTHQTTGKKNVAENDDNEVNLYSFDAAELDRELIESRLQRDVSEQDEGIIRRHVSISSSSLIQDQDLKNANMKLIKRGIVSCVTCVAVTPDNRFVYCGLKSGHLVKFDLNTGCRVKGTVTAKVHGSVNCVAISSCGRFMATGGSGPEVKIFQLKSAASTEGGGGEQPEIEDEVEVKVFKHHRDSVTALAFRKGPNVSLYSASKDRTVKVYNIDEMSYVETLFGHQESIVALDSCGRRERCITCGGRDRTVRLWKIVEESQLVFRASSGRVMRNEFDRETDPAYFHFVDETGSVDCVAFVDDQRWVSGSDGGTLSLWSVQRKKPIVSIPNAHGRTVAVSCDNGDGGVDLNNQGLEAYRETLTPQTVHIQSELDEVTIESVREAVKGGKAFVSNANWITAVAAIPYSNLIASGSHDGHVRLWVITDSDDSDDAADEADQRKRPQQQLKQIAKFPVRGYVNSLRFSESGKYLVAGVGREHRMGRWQTVKNSRNMLAIIPIPSSLFDAPHKS